MAFTQFKRIGPPLPPPEVMQAAADRMLAVLFDIPRDEWDEFLEPEDLYFPIPATEFVENVCPECGGYRLMTGPPSLGLDANWCRVPGRWPYIGHRAKCSRWLKVWQYKDFCDGILYGADGWTQYPLDRWETK